MIPYYQRPSHGELNGKLRAAIDLLTLTLWAPAIPAKLLADLHRLGLFTMEEQGGAFMAALAEIDPGHYIGRRPPEKSYEKRIYGREMFAFCWLSSRFRRVMYFKFCVTRDLLFILSFHEHRERK